MKKTFLAGLAVIVPVFVTIAIFVFIIELITSPFLHLAEHLIALFDKNSSVTIEKYPHILHFIARIIIILSLTILTMITGLLTRHFILRWWIHTIHGVMLRIPFVKTIYKILKEITHSVLNTEKKAFNKTVLVPYPQINSWAIGFSTGSTVPNSLSPSFKEKKTRETVFIPTAPHPISGYVLFYDTSSIFPIDVETEDVLKFLVSCGIYELKKAPQSQPNVEK